MTDETSEMIMDLVKADSHDVHSIYRGIRNHVLDEIVMTELSVTRMIAILSNLYANDKVLFEYVIVFLGSPLQSYQSVADHFGRTRQNVSYRLHRAAMDFPEIRLLLDLRMREVRRNSKTGPSCGGGRCEVRRPGSMEK